ncbi:hypothetical protein BGZ73_003354 [Actinomortierella ambigua]|nr:hypothetical protein BGZ73_003354 [Actinomortierella ambigua]
MNEAYTTRLFHDLSLGPEVHLTGTWGTRPVDCLVTSKDLSVASFVGACKVKKDSTFTAGHAQNIAQLEATLAGRLEHYCRSNGKDVDLVSFGIVTGACCWEFIELRMKATGASCNNPELLARRKTRNLKIEYDKEDL